MDVVQDEDGLGLVLSGRVVQLVPEQSLVVLVSGQLVAEGVNVDEPLKKKKKDREVEKCSARTWYVCSRLSMGGRRQSETRKWLAFISPLRKPENERKRK